MTINSIYAFSKLEVRREQVEGDKKIVDEVKGEGKKK